MATGPDPDAPDWFKPEPVKDNGAAEAMLAVASATGERSEEREVVYTDDLSPDDNVRGGATTTDTDAEIIEASREFDDAEAPEFQGDIPEFTDWREELRERLKRIRARRERERLAAGGTDEDAVAASEDALEEDEEATADADAAPEKDAEDTAEEDEEAGTAEEAAPEHDEEPEADDDTAGETPLVELDGDLDPAPEAESGADIDFTLDTEAAGADPDFDLSEGVADDSPAALILGEKKAELSAPDAEGLDDLIAEGASPMPDDDTSDESVTAPLEAFSSEAAASEEPLPTEAVDGAPELDFDDTPAALTTPLEIDLTAVEKNDDQALEWDREAAEAGPTAASSAGPLGERAAAAVCDLLVLTSIGAALVGAASSATGLPFRQILVSEALWLGLAWSIFAISYSVFFIGSCGQTIGRMIMRLRVVGDDQFSVGFDRAAIRLAAWVPCALPLFAGLLPALRDPQRRGLHDRLSHTRVVKA